MMTSTVFQEATWLDTAHNHGYGLLPIPCARDVQISDLIRRWMVLDRSEMSKALPTIDAGQTPTLLAYSERMSSLAVRTNNRDFIVLGLLALGLDGWRTDWRENTALLVLHFDVSNKLGVSPVSTFEEAAKLLSIQVSTSLMEFLKRSPEDQTLEAMGYIESSDDDGFRYLRTW